MLLASPQDDEARAQGKAPASQQRSGLGARFDRPLAPEMDEQEQRAGAADVPSFDELATIRTAARRPGQTRKRRCDGGSLVASAAGVGHVAPGGADGPGRWCVVEV